LSDREIAALLFPGGEGVPSYKSPDYEYVHRELMKPGTTQQLLWMEYCDQCRDAGEIPYQLTAFKRRYREYATQTKATMALPSPQTLRGARVALQQLLYPPRK